jgi:predicted dehydrogenase
MTQVKPLRWGLIGTGGIAASFAGDLARTTSGVPLAVGSRAQNTADAFADRFDIPHRYSSYKALVEDPDVDVVYVATPHPFHYENTMQALQAGKPALVEKAFTMNATEARELVAAARNAGLFLMEAMWTRFLPHIAEIRRLIDDGVLGQIVTVMADHGKDFAQDASSRIFAPELGGSALLDMGVYNVAFASMVLGTPTRVAAMISPAFTGVDGLTSTILGYPNGAQAVLSCTTSAATPTGAVIAGTDARIEIDPVYFTPTSFTVVNHDGERARHSPEAQGRLRYEADEVARCLDAGLFESPLMPLDETVAIMETMDEILAQGTDA